MLLLTLATLAVVPAPRSKNAVGLHAVVPFPRWGLAVSYERRLGRHTSLDVQLEHLKSARGFTHLPGFEESIGLALWPSSAGRGLFVRPNASVAHNVFYRIPRTARHTARLGAEVGARLPVGERLWVGAGIGARYGWAFAQNDSICTYEYQCPTTRAGAVVRGRVSIGVRW